MQKIQEFLKYLINALEKQLLRRLYSTKYITKVDKNVLMNMFSICIYHML